MAVATKSSTEALYERIGKPLLVPNSMVETVLDLTRKNDWEVLQWRQLGQGNEVHGIYGKFQVAPRQTGASIQQLFDAKAKAGLMNFEVLVYPEGITDPVASTIEVRAGSYIR